MIVRILALGLVAPLAVGCSTSSQTTSGSEEPAQPGPAAESPKNHETSETSTTETETGAKTNTRAAPTRTESRQEPDQPPVELSEAEGIPARGPPEPRWNRKEARILEGSHDQGVANLVAIRAAAKARSCAVEQTGERADGREVVLQFTIPAEGAIREIEVVHPESPGESPLAVDCLVETLRGLAHRGEGPSRAQVRYTWDTGETNGSTDRQQPTPKPSVTIETPEVTGGFDADLVAEVIEQHRRELKYCYGPKLAKDPELEGRMRVVFTVNRSGETVAPTVESSDVDHDGLEQCVVETVAEWPFPDPETEARIEVSVTFENEAR